MQLYRLNPGEQTKQKFVASVIAELSITEPIEVVIRKPKKHRSSPQNRIWHKWVQIIAEEKGYGVEEMKHLLKLHILGATEFLNKKTGNIMHRVRSTAELTTDEFSRLMDQTAVLAAQDGIILPFPDEIT